MGKTKHLTSNTFVAIMDMKVGGKQTKVVADQIGVSDHIVRQYIPHWREGGYSATPAQRKRSRRPHKVFCESGAERTFLDLASPHIQNALRFSGGLPGRFLWVRVTLKPPSLQQTTYHLMV